MSKLTPEDLMDTVIAADVVRRQLQGKALSPDCGKRFIGESFFNLIGGLVGRLLRCLPWPLRWRADQRIVRAMGARPEAEPAGFPAGCQGLAGLAERLYKENGQWPATLIFTSHPETTGELEWLRFELFREGLLLGNAVVNTAQAGRLFRSAPCCFLAIDPFALDTVAGPVAGLYAGFMQQLYLASDRQSGTQNWLQRHLLLRKTGYRHIASRLVARLKQGAPVVMVFPGGLPHNARLYYAAREFVHALRVKHWPYAQRVAQKKWMEILSRPVNGSLPILSGELPGPTRAALQALLQEWGFSEPEQRARLDAFAAEFRSTVPYRERLFRVLLGRIAAKGQPLLFIALSHADKAPHVHLSQPWAAYRAPSGELRLIRGADGNPEPLADIRQMAMDFSREFVV